MAAGANTGNFGAFKRVYDSDAPTSLLQRRKGLFAKLGTDRQRLKGEALYTDVEVMGNEAIGAINENEQVPTPQHVRHVQPKVSPKLYAASVQFSELGIAMASDNESGFAKMVENNLKNLEKSFDKRLEQDVWRPGKTFHAAITATATSATQTVDAAWMLREGVVYDVWNAALSTLVEPSVQIRSKDVSSNQVVLDRSITGTATNVFVPAGELTNAPAEGKALTGLQAIVDDGTYATNYLNVSRSTYSNWRGIIYNAASGSISSDLLQRMLDRVMFNSEESDPPMLMSNAIQRREYLDTVTPQVRFSGEKLDLDSGHNSITFNGIPWEVYVDCPVDEIYGMTCMPTKAFTPKGERQYLNPGGGGNFYPRPGYLGRWATLYTFLNLICRQPNGNFRIHSLATRGV